MYVNGRAAARSQKQRSVSHTGASPWAKGTESQGTHGLSTPLSYQLAPELSKITGLNASFLKTPTLSSVVAFCVCGVSICHLQPAKGCSHMSL